MRIIGGKLAGRRFAGPKQEREGLRPTADRVREAIASALDARGAIRDRVVLDAFAGTGALGFEALSRGASRAVFVDDDARLLAAITHVAGELDLRAQTRTLKLDLLARATAPVPSKLRELGPFSLVFLDPPYASADAAARALERWTEAGLLTPGAFVVFEHPTKNAPAFSSSLAVAQSYRYGDTSVTLLEAPS